MNEINLHAELLQRGFTSDEIARLVRTGELAKVRRGAYSEPPPAERTPAEAHRDLTIATMRQLCGEAVAGYVSAAVLHGLPTWTDQLDRVHVTRDRSGGGKHLHNLQVHGIPVAAAEITTIDGIRATGLARTVLDLACQQSLERSVAAGDAALRLGLEPAELLAAVEAARGRRGIRRARTMAELVDARSESAGESVSRVRFWRWGLPAPVPQLEICDGQGRFVARCDFGWAEFGTVGEFDGRSKYGDLLQPGQTTQDAVLAEKRREDRIRELGWQVVRWTWSDLSNRAALTARVQAALARGRRMAA